MSSPYPEAIMNANRIAIGLAVTNAALLALLLLQAQAPSALASPANQGQQIPGDAAAVHGFLKLDPASAIAKSSPRGWDALTHLCFSRYLRLDTARSDGFVRAATSPGTAQRCMLRRGAQRIQS